MKITRADQILPGDRLYFVNEVRLDNGRSVVWEPIFIAEFEFEERIDRRRYLRFSCRNSQIIYIEFDHRWQKIMDGKTDGGSDTHHIFTTIEDAEAFVKDFYGLEKGVKK